MATTKFGDKDVLLVSVVDATTGAPPTPGAAFSSGLLANTSPLVQTLAGAPSPAVITISGSAGASRRIELSTDGGTVNGWFTPQYDASTSTMINVQESGATHVRMTGAAGDAWSVR